MSADQIVPFVFESLPVRGALIHLSRAWRRMLRDHDYTPVIRDTLGHAAAATGLIAHSLKFDGTATLQIQSEGKLSMLVMQATSDLELRGMATAQSVPDATTFDELMVNAHCAITVDAGDRPYQGIVAMAGPSLSASLEHYFDRSVQVPSHVILIASEFLSGGILLQQMPGQTPIDEDAWSRLGFLAATLTSNDLSNNSELELLGKLFAEDDIRVFESQPIVFRCRCNRGRAEEVLRMLGEDEATAAVEEQGSVEVTCEYCGRREAFDAVDISELFVDNVVSAPGRLQ